MTGRNQNSQRKRYQGDGRESPSGNSTYSSRDSPSPTNFGIINLNGRSSPLSIPYNGYSSSDSEDESRLPYAGAKFNSPPPANVLPVPPSSWLMSSQADQVSLNIMSQHLRQMLKVTA